MPPHMDDFALDDTVLVDPHGVAMDLARGWTPSVDVTGSSTSHSPWYPNPAPLLVVHRAHQEGPVPTAHSFRCPKPAAFYAPLTPPHQPQRHAACSAPPSPPSTYDVQSNYPSSPASGTRTRETWSPAPPQRSAVTTQSGLPGSSHLTMRPYANIYNQGDVHSVQVPSTSSTVYQTHLTVPDFGHSTRAVRSPDSNGSVGSSVVGWRFSSPDINSQHHQAQSPVPPRTPSSLSPASTQLNTPALQPLPPDNIRSPLSEFSFQAPPKPSHHQVIQPTFSPQRPPSSPSPSTPYYHSQPDFIRLLEFFMASQEEEPQRIPVNLNPYNPVIGVSPEGESSIGVTPPHPVVGGNGVHDPPAELELALSQSLPPPPIPSHPALHDQTPAPVLLPISADLTTPKFNSSPHLSGYRTTIRASDLTPVNAPPKARTYKIRSATSHKDAVPGSSPSALVQSPGSTGRKRTADEADLSEMDVDSEGHGTPIHTLPPGIPGVSQKTAEEIKREKNRESQRRSRQRKHQTLEGFQMDVARLTKEKDDMRNELIRERDEWKERALRAEARLQLPPPPHDKDPMTSSAQST